MIRRRPTLFGFTLGARRSEALTPFAVVEPEEIGWTVSVEFASDTPSKLEDFKELEGTPALRRRR